MSCHAHADLGMINHCTELCDLVQSRLCEIDNTILYIQENASLFVSEDIKEMMADLTRSKENILSKVHQISLSVDNTDSYNKVKKLTQEAYILLDEANNVSIVRMGAIKSMIQESLDSAIRENQDELLRISEGMVQKRGDLPSFLETISDSEVRSAVRILSRNPEYNNLTLDEIKKTAEKRLHPETALSLQNENQIKEKILSDMKQNQVDEKVIDDIMNNSNSSKNILEIITESDKAIISEKIRKKTINAIISNITNKGFIVDKKKIRLIRETDTVKITAQKPGGQLAEFRINLDGSFIYKFDEYEGQACQKDIVPFIEDLESIYGIKVGNIREVRLNPDKTSKRNYQSMDIMKRG